MPLSRHSVGTYPDTRSQETCQGTLGHSRLSSPSHCGLILSGISVRELISNSKKKERKKAQAGMNGRTFSRNPRKRGKGHKAKTERGHLVT